MIKFEKNKKYVVVVSKQKTAEKGKKGNKTKITYNRCFLVEGNKMEHYKTLEGKLKGEMHRPYFPSDIRKTDLTPSPVGNVYEVKVPVEYNGKKWIGIAKENYQHQIELKGKLSDCHGIFCYDGDYKIENINCNCPIKNQAFKKSS
nr:hypothetical protein GTC16762_33970 [Pigmentibacter ruber]